MTPAEIAELVGRFGLEDMKALVRGAGKKVTQANDCQCPLEGCLDQGPEARLNARIRRGNEAWVLFCHRCHGSADYIALYRATKGVDFLTAVEQLRGLTPASPAKPALKLVRSPVLEPDKEKLSPDKVKSAWDALARDDEAGRAYLEGRRLAEAIGAGLVRFATADCSVKEVAGKAKKGFRVGALLSDVAGRPGGVQFRTVLAGADGDKMRSLAGGRIKGVYFGNAGDVLGSSVVVVAEGLADTLAAQLWTRGQPELAVVGAPGTGQLAPFADALEDAGIDVGGRLFVLLAQRDRGARGNQSLSAFMSLKAKLTARGADVVLAAEPPGEFKDWALSWQHQQLGEWPPREVERYLAAGDDGDGGMVRAGAAAIWQPAGELEPQGLGRDLQSLAHLLASETSRRSICGPGTWALNEMTGYVEYGGRALTDGDYTRLRFNVESFKAMDQKKLKFSDGETRAVTLMLAEKSPYHPVRRYLEGLQPAGADVFLDELPAALRLNPETQGLQCEYLRVWCVGAVARAFKPGCQMDSMLVFHGLEGLHKSRFFEELGGPWYVATSDEIGGKDFIEALRRGWIVELDELDAMARADFSKVKSGITRPTDYYSPKWVRQNVGIPRHSVLGGTTNDVAFLPAMTGDRRFWVVDIDKLIDRPWVHDNRDRIWGWAVKHWRDGAEPRLAAEYESLRAEANKKYQAPHPWQAFVEAYIAARPAIDELRIEDLLLDERVIGLTRAQLHSGHTKTVGTILRNLGWAPSISGHLRVRVWKRVET